MMGAAAFAGCTTTVRVRVLVFFAISALGPKTENESIEQQTAAAKNIVGGGATFPLDGGRAIDSYLGAEPIR